MRNKLHHYAVIKFPLITKLTMNKTEDNSTLADVEASKHQIKQAMRKLEDIEVAKVNTLIRPDGRRRHMVHWLLTIMLWLLPTKLDHYTESSWLILNRNFFTILETTKLQSLNEMLEK